MFSQSLSALCSLPEYTIPAGAHVSLDVRAGKLCIVRVAGEMCVVFTEYAVQSQDAALELFAYLERHRSRFASVKIR